MNAQVRPLPPRDDQAVEAPEEWSEKEVYRKIGKEVGGSCTLWFWIRDVDRFVKYADIIIGIAFASRHDQ
jgi:hypothetical protein